MTARMQLLEWTPIGKGALIGKAKIMLPNGLEIDNVRLFRRADGASWAQMPSEMMRDGDGLPIKDNNGRTRYRTLIRWRSKDLQERFSAALIELIEESTRPGAAPLPRPAASPRPSESQPRRRGSQHPPVRYGDHDGRPFDDDLSDVGRPM